MNGRNVYGNIRKMHQNKLDNTYRPQQLVDKVSLLHFLHLHFPHFAFDIWMRAVNCEVFILETVDKFVFLLSTEECRAWQLTKNLGLLWGLWLSNFHCRAPILWHHGKEGLSRILSWPYTNLCCVTSRMSFY